MSKSILKRIQQHVEFHQARRKLCVRYWRDESNDKQLRKGAARMALRSDAIVIKLLQYKQQFTRPTLPCPPFIYEIEVGAGKTQQRKARREIDAAKFNRYVRGIAVNIGRAPSRWEK